MRAGMQMHARGCRWGVSRDDLQRSVLVGWRLKVFAYHCINSYNKHLIFLQGE